MMTEPTDAFIEDGPWRIAEHAIGAATMPTDIHDLIAARQALECLGEWGEGKASEIANDDKRSALKRAVGGAWRRILKTMNWPVAGRKDADRLGLMWVLGPGGYQETRPVLTRPGEWVWIRQNQRGLSWPHPITAETGKGGLVRFQVDDGHDVKWVGIGAIQAQRLRAIEDGSKGLVGDGRELVGEDPSALVAEYAKEATREVDGMLAADAALATELAAIAFDGINAFREARREVFADFQAGKAGAADLWRLWLPADDSAATRARTLLAEALWPSVELELAAARPESILFVSADGDRYQKVPKATGAVSWAMGVPGAVEVNEDRYQPAPGFVRYVPRGIGIVSGGPPSQRSLALDIPTDNTPHLELIAARDASAVVGPLASKALVLMLMQAPANGEWVKISLDDFTRLCHRHAKRVQIGRDRVRTAEGLVEIERLRLVFPDGTHAPLLAIRRPDKVAKGQTVGWGLTQPAVALTSPGGGAIAGWMLLNFDGIARIPVQRTASLRLYLAAGARWNDTNMPGFRNAPLELEEWARRTNSLSPIALDASNKRHNKSLSETKRQIRQEIEYLTDEARLASVEKIGSAYRLDPTEAHDEAYRMFRKGAARGGN